ncbi:hypothetical protein FDZ73_21570, partial [bacterium]
MRGIFKRRLWMRVMAILLALALNLGAVDGIINGVLKGINTTARVNSTQPAYADPGDGSFSPREFDPNHNETSTLSFRFDYDHECKVELFRDGDFVKTLEDEVSYEGDWDDPDDRKENPDSPSGIINRLIFDGREGDEPMDDGMYTVKITPLDEWSEFPLKADVRIKNYPHIPTHDVSIDYITGLITVNGNSDKNDKIIIYVNGTETATTKADSSGRWQWSSDFTEGNIYTISAEAENKWGTRSKGRSNPNRFEIYQVRKGDDLAGIADFYYYGDSNSTAARQDKIIQATRLPLWKYIQTDWYLLIKDPTIAGIYSPYTDPANLVNKEDETLGDPQYCESAGEPVNPVTGNYFTIKTDLAISGRGLPLEITRTYNNQREYQGPFGWGWDFTYNQRLVFFGSGEIGHQRGDGGVDYYTPDGNGGYKPPVGSYDKLVKNPDRTYTLTQKDKTSYYFDLTGRLQTITDRNGNQIKINYNPADLITSIQDAGG